MPWDIAAANDEAGAAKRRDVTIAGADANWLRTQQAYGLEGPWADHSTNPYSQAALLQRSYDDAQRGSVNSYAARGQLYAGSLANARNANTFGFNQSRDELQKGYVEAHAGYQSERQSALDAYQEAINNARWARIQTGIEAPLEPEAAPEPSPQGGGRKRSARKRKGRR